MASMNAVEIEEAISKLADQQFDPEEFPYAFLEAFGNKSATIKKLRSGASNRSDVAGGVLQTSYIHLAVAESGEVGAKLAALKASLTTTKYKAKFVLATDGETIEAEEVGSGEPLACDYADLPNKFGFFLPLAGITVVRQIVENAFDIRATRILNKLYLELRKENPEWDTSERRHDMNHFVARLIFCFFAEDTGIFLTGGLFTSTIEQMSARDGSNVHEVLAELFRAMNTKPVEREREGIRPYANSFPYVNGGLFSGSLDVLRFSRIARAYLLQIGGLDWTKINPDIFGSMIQAVADDEERGSLGMHYTSVPNILKVLNPLFLDDLRTQLDAAEENVRKLLNLRERIKRIRVFDPACGSGNFLVIAYKQMRAIEAEINTRRGEPGRKSDIPLTNFRGIELRDFAAEIARLALIIAEFQADVEYLGQKEALAEFLPLNRENWITCGNALRINWLELWPADNTGVRVLGTDLFSSPLDQAQIDFENEVGETYICGNPPFKGARKQTDLQKSDMSVVFGGGNAYKDCDYVSAWYLKSSEFSNRCPTDFAFVSTNSISRGEQVEHIWSRLYANKESVRFCHTQFKWANNASHNAGVWCVIIGATRDHRKQRLIISDDINREVTSISPYLIPGNEDYIRQTSTPISNQLPALVSGSMARDGGGLILENDERNELVRTYPDARELLRTLIGTTEIRQGSQRWCLWLDDINLKYATQIAPLQARIEAVRTFRISSSAKTTQGYARIPHRFAQRSHQEQQSIVVPKNTIEAIRYITPVYVSARTITTDLAFVSYTRQIWVLSIIAATLHRVWAEAISGGLGSGIRYSSHITYNAFPLPTLTEKNKTDLTRCAEDILLTREAHFPATIADLYDPEKMPADLREAHERNDAVLESIYIGRRFKNDTERLEKLFDLYTKMVAARGNGTAAGGAAAKRKRVGASA